MTNYEKIIANLTPEKVAEVATRSGCFFCPIVDDDKACHSGDERSCKAIVLEWLKQEAE